MGNRHPDFAPHNAFRCRGEERWCAIAVTNEEEWQALYEVLGEPPWAQDPKFTDMNSRVQNAAELEERIEAWTKDRSPHQVMRILQKAGVPAGVVQNGEDLYLDPHLRARDFLEIIDDPLTGPIEYPRCSVHLSDTPGSLDRWPHLGEANAEILGELLGCSSDELHRLSEANILR